MMMHHDALTDRRVPVLRAGCDVSVNMDMPMKAAMTMMTPLGFAGDGRRPMSMVSARSAMAGDRRRQRTMMKVVAPAGCRRLGLRRLMMMVADPGLGRRGDERQRSQGRGRRERRPDEGCHDSILCPWRANVTTQARNVFNTMGTSPGKSSLIRPGPNASAQAA